MVAKMECIILPQCQRKSSSNRSQNGLVCYQNVPNTPIKRPKDAPSRPQDVPGASSSVAGDVKMVFSYHAAFKT